MPLRVHLHRTCEGILVDISQHGALVRLPSAQAKEKQITIHLELQGLVMHFRGRVVRCSPYRVQMATATLARTEYHVAVEFREVSPDGVAALRRILEASSQRTCSLQQSH